MAEDSAKGHNFKSYNLEKAQKKKTESWRKQPNWARLNKS